MATGTRLLMSATVVLGVTAYWAGVGASSSWQYYLTVDECLDSAPDLSGQPIRVSGTVAVRSLKIADDRLSASFQLEGIGGVLDVNCRGAIPDNLAEGRQVVVEGSIGSHGCLQGNRVLTRCASKYTSDVPTQAIDAPGPRQAP